MDKPKNILFLTTASLAANPRLVKEFGFLKKYYNCTVISFWHQDWSASLTQQIMQANLEVQFVSIDRKKELNATLLSKFLHKISIWLNPIFKNKIKLVAFASNDKTAQLLRRTKQLVKQQSFEVVIAHNLGTFYPAMTAAQQQGSKLQLDIEDFYPGEALYFNKTNELGNRHYMMQAAFAKAHAISYASEGIGRKCMERYNIPSSVKQTTIINSFNSADFKKPTTKSDGVTRCVWFSQHIGPNRGLEQVFEAAKLHPESEFHLIGNQNSAYINQHERGANIHFHSIMSQPTLHTFLENMNIGLALEPGKDENNKIALSNKILAYAQAGLYILATPTDGQQQFLESLPYKAGELIAHSLGESIAKLDGSCLDLPAKINRWEQAKAFSWEEEEQKLMTLLS